MKFIYAVGLIVLVLSFQNCQNSAMRSSAGSTVDLSTLSDAPTSMPSNYSVVGPIANYDSIQIDENALSITLNLQTGRAQGGVSDGITGSVQSCNLQSVRDRIQSIIATQNICISHGDPLPAGSGCAAVNLLGYATLIRNNEKIDATMPQQLDLGGSAPDNAGECQSQYVLCDPLAEEQLNSLFKVLTLTSSYTACDPRVRN